MKFTKVIDISLPLSATTITYPGNPQVEIETLKSASGSSVISKLSLGSHTGTHIDAPKHVFKTGKTLDELPLTTFVGPCRVIDATEEKAAVSLNFVKLNNVKKDERILFKTTNSNRGYKIFYDDYVYLSGDAAKYLAEKKVILVGIDYLSVKQRGSRDNSPHTHLLSKDIPILEGIDLSKVEAKEYFLVVLPLKFTDLDGVPARAILLEE